MSDRVQQLLRLHWNLPSLQLSAVLLAVKLIFPEAQTAFHIRR